ncbi:toll-like receptor 12 [Phyllostomus hastatus]|uniref:toll-like receptor 12 n=1 Tax=Phyllostomus hastatus TaxID=9423 RepID=UPI001E684DDF|nr:toll-like receptor 12 [Phyllostomus hastatus]XP_045715277.1 toll-like receptor 12 [Phyllostomus hastatus]
MDGHLLLPGLLLFLPLTTGWTASNCLVTEGSRLHLVSHFFLCRLDSSLPLLAFCSSVSNLTQALEAVPQGIEGLCLGGSASVLPPDAFSRFPGLKILRLFLSLTKVLPGALRGLGQLQQLSFTCHCVKDFFLPPDAFGNLSSLQHLHFQYPCLDRNLSVRLPPTLRRLGISRSCLQDVGKLADIFPDLVLGHSSGDAWTLDVLDLSFNRKLTMASPGALQGLQVGTLNLGHTMITAAAVKGLGLRRLDALSVEHTDVTELPAEAVARFELLELNVEFTRIGRITPEALASCRSLKSLSLKNSGLTDLPPGFLAALPGLQRLNLGSNKLQSAVLCTNETGAVSGLGVLDLSHNGLQSLPPGAFSCLPHLQELLLRGNQLDWLEGQVFQGLRRLERLDLSYNPLVTMGEAWLAHLPELTTLNLLSTSIMLSPTWDFWGPENLHDLRLQFPSGPSGAVLSVPTRLTSLELCAAPGRKLWKLASPIFPVLQTLTLNGWGLQLETQNITKIFPALRQLFLRGNSLEALCSQDTSSFFLWQLPRLQYLRVQGDGHSPRPCCITGLPNLQELELQRLQSRARPHSVRLEELVGELPRLQVLRLTQTGLETLSATAFQGLGSLQVLVLDREAGIVLDGSLQEHSPQMPQYMYILSSSLACQCANAWLGPWLKRTSRTYVHIEPRQLCRPEAGGHSKSPLFPFLWSHCPKTLGLELFLGSSALLFLLISLPFLQEARNSWILYLQALFRAWLQDLRGRKGEGKRFLYDVFVSHCRQDQAWVVQELLPTLEGSRGLRLCLPERDFEPGNDVADNVAESMASSRVTLCVLSCQALGTPRCCLELHLATSLLLATPHPPVLLVVFLEPVSRHQLPRYHRLARLLRRGDYYVWPKEDERKDDFWAWLGSRLGQAGLG